jgi:hypothetical protein
MDKRFQVFVSSTYQDLQEERQEVMHALLELDCIPSGMELFPAANEDQWSVIKRVIDDCDYYVLVIGGRYGSLGPDGISYTEMEYRHALSKDKPTIAFIHKDPGSIPANKSEDSDEGKQKLAAFRELVKTKLCKYWSNPDDLGSVVSRSLIRLTKEQPAVGWVRADELPDRDASLELVRLTKQVEDLTAQLQRLRTTAPQGTENLAQGEDLFEIGYTFTYLSPTLRRQRIEQSLEISWNGIFSSLAPGMIHELSDAQLRETLTSTIAFTADRTIDVNVYPAPDNLEINESDFQTIKIQLRSLGLIVRSEKTRSVRDVETYWTLTPYGDQLMTQLRAIKRQTSTG